MLASCKDGLLVILKANATMSMIYKLDYATCDGCRVKGLGEAKLKQYVSSLNEQFAKWVAQQWQNKPDRLWSHGLTDYLRHSVIIKRDCASQTLFPALPSFFSR